MIFHKIIFTWKYCVVFCDYFYIILCKVRIIMSFFFWGFSNAFPHINTNKKTPISWLEIVLSPPLAFEGTIIMCLSSLRTTWERCIRHKLKCWMAKSSPSGLCGCNAAVTSPAIYDHFLLSSCNLISHLQEGPVSQPEGMRGGEVVSEEKGEAGCRCTEGWQRSACGRTVSEVCAARGRFGEDAH